MLFGRDILQGIAEGRVTLAFRRWRRAPPADGSSLRSPVGVLLPRSCHRRSMKATSRRRTCAARACLSMTYARRSAVRARCCASSSVSPVTIRASPFGNGCPSNAELEAIVARLARLDSGSSTPWTTRYLQMIADQPGIVSRKLAQQVDVDVPPFKRRVRQLKELGLTESLEVGYRLSRRGRAVLERVVSAPR